MTRLQARRRSGRRWTATDIPDQAGRTAVITGASNGIGLEIARVLAGRAAHLVLACRDAGRGQAAVDRIAAALGAAGSRPGAVSLPTRPPGAASSTGRTAVMTLVTRCR